MNKDEFTSGIFVGVLVTVAIVVVVHVGMWMFDSVGYRNKLVIKYENYEKAYDRQMMVEFVNNSNIATNFVNQELDVSPWRMEWKLSNPDNK